MAPSEGAMKHPRRDASGRGFQVVQVGHLGSGVRVVLGKARGHGPAAGVLDVEVVEDPVITLLVLPPRGHDPAGRRVPLASGQLCDSGALNPKPSDAAMLPFTCLSFVGSQTPLHPGGVSTSPTYACMTVGVPMQRALQ